MVKEESILGEINGGGKLKLKKENINNYNVKILRNYAISLNIKIKKNEKLISKNELIKKIKSKLN
jgi:hypothetical protein